MYMQYINAKLLTHSDSLDAVILKIALQPVMVAFARLCHDSITRLQVFMVTVSGGIPCPLPSHRVIKPSYFNYT